MEAWAKRIETRLQELADAGKTRAGLAKACKVQPSSVSAWLGKGAKPTEMIRGDNLLAAARYLYTTPDWIMTGRGSKDVTAVEDSPAISDSSYSARLDQSTVEGARVMARTTLILEGVDFDSLGDVDVFVAAYAFVADPTLETRAPFDTAVAERIAKQTRGSSAAKHRQDSGSGTKDGK